MLALVRKEAISGGQRPAAASPVGPAPGATQARIELSIHGEQVDELLAWIREKYEVAVLADDPEDELVSIESTEYWQEMEKNRAGNLLAGARLKAALTQAQLAREVGIRQNMISDYERGRRTPSATMARRLGAVLEVREEHLRYGSGPDDSGSAGGRA
ncbi:MAG: helix-turn-helix transcriptional regulator [Candidatus Latescibacterota bacterium]